MRKEFNQICQFKVTLKYIEPAIWRRIQVSENYSFWALHVAIQDSMGWSDFHLHGFRMIQPATGLKVNIGIPDEEMNIVILPGRTEKMAKYFSLENPDADYIYDFGDNWEHSVNLGKILPAKEGTKYPLCTGGKRACPPEDCGGVPGYENFLQIIRNPEHEEYESMVSWIGGKFDPEHFNSKEVVFNDPDERWELANSSQTE